MVAMVGPFDYAGGGDRAEFFSRKWQTEILKI